MSCNRADLATACGQNVARDTVSCCLWGIPKEKSLLTVYMSKVRHNTETVLNNFAMFMYGDTHYITNLFRKYVQNIVTS